MSHWDILGIARTTDERDIRKAYARILKTIDQELEPEKFITLREALEAARQEAYYASLELEDDPEDDIFGGQALAENSVASDSRLSQPAAATDYQADKPITKQPLTDQLSAGSSADTQATVNTTQEPEPPLHQHGFEFLLNAIQQQNSQLDLRKELVDYVDYISSLPDTVLTEAQAKWYIQQLDSACIATGLSGINDFLNIRQEQQQAGTASPAGAQADSTDNTLSLKAQEQHFKEKLDQLCQQLWNEHFNDENFATFQQCLKEWPEQSLEHQMATYDQLSYVLGSAQDQTEASNRFLLGWYQHFGNDVPPASAEGALHRLHDRIEVLLVERQFWNNIPAKYYSALHELKQGTSFQPFSMLALLRDTSSLTVINLKRQHWLLPDMQSVEHNPNLHYLRICAAWEKYWLPMLMVCFGSILACVSADSEQTPYLIAGSLLLSLVWLPLIQAPLQSLLYSKENHEQVMQRLTLGWYFGLAVVILLSPLLSMPVLATMLWLYSLLSAFIMGHGLYHSSSLFDEFPQVIRIQADTFIVYAGFIAVVAACAAVVNMFAEGSIAAPLSLILAIPLIMSLVIQPFIASVLMQLIRSQQGLKFYWGICAVYGLLYLNTFVFEWTTWPLDLSEYRSFWLASFSLAFIWMPMALSPRKMAYFLKYATYVLGIVVALRLIFISIWLAYLLYQTAKADREV